MSDLVGDHPPAPPRVSSRTTWLAWLVTVGIVATIALTVSGGTEAWPLTSFRLFSNTRTAHSTSLSLVAVAADGSTTPVRPDAHHEFTRRTSHQYHLLAGRGHAERRTMVDAWLRAAGLDPDDFTTVELRRKTRTLDPDGGPAHVGKVTTILTVDLHP